MTAKALLLLWLTALWVLLWGDLGVGNVVAGIVVGGIVIWAFPPGPDRGAGVHPVAVVRFGVFFAWALLVSNLTVAIQVLRPRRDLAEAIVAVPLRTASPLIASFVANAITLTPGTLTVDIRPRGLARDATATPPVLFVHCLVVGDPDDVRSDGLELEAYAVRAFGTRADRAALAGPAPPWPPPEPGVAP